MGSMERLQLQEVLRSRREAIAERWHDAIAQTSFVPLATAELRQRLLELTGQMIALLFTEPFPRQEAQSIGAALADLHYLQPETLGRTQEVLAREFTADLSPEQLIALHPRLPMLLGEIAAGFSGAARDTILAEQEQIREALLAERKQAMEALQESEERYRRLVELSPEAIVVHSYGEMLYVNQAAASLLGAASPDELIGRSVLDFAHPDWLEAVEARMNQIQADQQPVELMEQRLVQLDGQVIDIEVVSAPISYQGQPAVQVIARDITARKQAEAELAEARRQLANSREAERLRLAQELHDGPVQDLSGVAFWLEALARWIHNEAGLAQLTTAQGILRQTVQRLRAMCEELRPQTLTPQGLAAAIRSHVQRFELKHAALDVTLDLVHDQQRLADPVRLALFRIYEQALNNVVQHAEARSVIIRLQFNRNQAVLEVRDDGRGFVVPAHLSELAREGHLGLLGAAERAEAVGGRLEVESAPGEGTKLMASVPVRRGQQTVSDH